jgi:predicted ABC-type ATPase
MPQLWIIAEPNGAGKSTIVARYEVNRLLAVNPGNLIEQASQSILLAGQLATNNAYHT